MSKNNFELTPEEGREIIEMNLTPEEEAKIISERIERKTVARQNELKRLSDEEIMQLDLKGVTSFGSMGLGKDKIDSGTALAADREVRRRAISAGWIWKRFFDRANFEKWETYQKLRENEAEKAAMEFLKEYKSSNSDPQ